MADEPFESGADPALDAQRLRGEALGEPGQRRFRLMAVIDGATYIVWMEKQQLQALGLALEQMLAQIPDATPEIGGGGPPGEFDLETRRQFRVGRMELGYDERADRIVVVAHDINDPAEEDEEEDEDEEAEPAAAFVCALSREQARELSADAAAIVAAGRPRCTMCGEPMGPGPHVCPQQNGHFRHDLEAVEDVEDV